VGAVVLLVWGGGGACARGGCYGKVGGGKFRCKWCCCVVSCYEPSTPKTLTNTQGLSGRFFPLLAYPLLPPPSFTIQGHQAESLFFSYLLHHHQSVVGKSDVPDVVVPVDERAQRLCACVGRVLDVAGGIGMTTVRR
jgi:hypothetical protein